MRIDFTQGGGLGYFPSLNKPVTIEVDRLEASEAEALKRLVEAAHFFIPFEDVTLQELIQAVQKQVKAARAGGRGTSPEPTADKSP